MEAISFCAHEVVSECGGARPKPIQSPVSGRKSWQPPPVDVLKLNFDGTFRATEKDGAWGFIIRDSDGQAVLAGSGRPPSVSDALSAEGEACLAILEAFG
jgi:hypothetical protein